jgi:tape measure domain-containing protein
MSQTTELGLLLYANVKNFVTGMERAEREFVRVGKRMENIGKTLSVGVSLPLAGLGVAAVSSAMKMESLEKGLIAVSGSSEAAQAQLERLKEVAKLPGLGLEEAVQGSVNLQAAGFSAEEAEASLQAFGNALATVGKGRAELDGVILALGQIQSKGKVSAEEINQLAERVPQIRQVMVEAFGTAVPEEIGKAGISAKEFVNTVTTELLKLPQVTGGLGNAFENLQDATTTSLARIGDGISKSLNLEGLFNGLAAGLDKLSIGFEQLDPSAQAAITAIGAVAIGVGPLVTAIGFFSSTIVPQFVKGLSVMKAGSASAAAGPVGLIM